MIDAKAGVTCGVRTGDAGDLPLVREMLYEAVHWPPGEGEKPPPETLLARPELSRYWRGWGRPGDALVVATDAGGESIGAAWYRLMPADAPGYGFVNAWTPELAIAVAAEHRGRGVGETLLRALTEVARSEGFGALSLSVRLENRRAARLYRRCGLREVSRSGDAATMKLDLIAPPAGQGPLVLDILPHGLCICRLDPGAETPGWAGRGGLLCVVRTQEELSVVCEERLLPPGIHAERGWRALRLEGPLDLSLVGVLASVLQPLAGAEIPIFALSTFDTDYVLVPDARLDEAASVLTRGGHRVRSTDDETTAAGRPVPRRETGG